MCYPKSGCGIRSSLEIVYSAELLLQISAILGLNKSIQRSIPRISEKRIAIAERENEAQKVNLKLGHRNLVLLLMSKCSNVSQEEKRSESSNSSSRRHEP